MFNRYRETAAATKLIILGIVSALVFAASWKTGGLTTAFINTGVVAGLMVALHSIISYPRFVKASLVSIAQLLILTTTATVYSYAYITEDPASASIIFLTIFSLLMLTSVIIVYIATQYGKGRLWLNLGAAFLITDFVGLLVGLTFNLPYLLAVVISVIAGLGFIAARSLFHRKPTVDAKEIRNELYQTPAITNKVEKLIKKEGWEAVQPTDDVNFWIVNTGKQIFIITGVYFAETLTKTKTGLTYKNVPVENIFGELSETASVISKTVKLPRQKTHFVVVDVNNKFSLPSVGYQAFGVASNLEKHKIIARVLIANAFGVASYSKKTKKEDIKNVWNNLTKSLTK